jgi:hypothetical protein
MKGSYSHFQIRYILKTSYSNKKGRKPTRPTKILENGDKIQYDTVDNTVRPVIESEEETEVTRKEDKLDHDEYSMYYEDVKYKIISNI